LQAAGKPDVLPAFSIISNPQKLATPTFQVPFWSTAVPVSFFSSGVPLTRMSYFTVAWVAELTVTFRTLAVAREARLEPDWLLMTDANCDPFSSSFTRLLFDVFALKNASQFVVIAATEPAGALPLVLALGDVVGDVAGDEVRAGADLAAEVGLLLPQAPRATVSAASAQTPTSCDIWRREFIQQSSNCPSVGGIPLWI
jgi:hypothetical protein